MSEPTERVSSYLSYLPAIFQQDADARGVSFLGRFLLAFEQVLSGVGDPDRPGLEERIERLHTYCIPGPMEGEQPPDPASRAPADFLPWLAGWVALSLRADWQEEERRRLISNIVPLYRLRGTAEGLKQMLETYTGMGAEIYELLQPFQVGVTSTIGVDTAIGGGAPHYFTVRLTLNQAEANFDQRVQIARALIEQEKPAHTRYDLQIILPTIQIGVTSTVGKDTLIGTPA